MTPGVTGRERTLSGLGATVAVIPMTGARMICAGATRMYALERGCPCTNDCCGTTVTPCGTVRFTYCTRLTSIRWIDWRVRAFTCVMLIR